MKPIMIFFALAVVASALPCTAQNAVTVPHYRHGFPIPPEATARLALFNEMERAGAKALQDGDFLAAEADYRKAIEASPWAPGYYGLGEALVGQGRITEAIEAYRAGLYGPPYTVRVLKDLPLHGLINPNVRDCPGGAATEDWMEYALLLSQTGQSAEAAIVYKKALPNVPDVNARTIGRFADPDTLSPAAFQASVHIALGLCASFGMDTFDTNHAKAMIEFDKARQLQPDSALTNYYGYGWQNLSPKDRAKLNDAQQAKAALQKAVTLDKGEVKQAAEKALQVAMKS